MIIPPPPPPPLSLPTETVTATETDTDTELGVLLFDPVDEWLLLDPIPQAFDIHTMLSSSPPPSTSTASASAAAAPLIEEEMKRVKLEEEAPKEEMQMQMQIKDKKDIQFKEEDDHKLAHLKEEQEQEQDSTDTEESSSASSTSSSSDDEQKDGHEQDREIEEGEILMDSDEDDDYAFKASPMSTNQHEDLSPVPKIDVHLEPHHQPLPIGHILSILGNRVIVEASVEHKPLNEGSIIWVTQTRSPLGLVDETFGPVRSPFYAIRYNSEEDVPPGISVGTAVSFVPEFASYVLNEDVYRKGYDIGEEEIDDEVEFSDDEKEAEYKRALRQAKRGSKNSNERRPGPVKTRRNVNFPRKNDGNVTPHFTHPIAPSHQIQQTQFLQNQFAQNQFFQNQLPQYQFQQNQLQQNQLQQNQMLQNQFQQNPLPQNHIQQNQFPQTQMPQYQFPQNQLMQNQLPQNQMLQNQLLLNLSMLASGMQIPGLGLAMNTNQNPFMSGGINFPPSTMQFNPGNMHLNPGNNPSSSERALMQGNSSIPNVPLNPINIPFSGEQPPMQILGKQGGNLQLSSGSSSFGGGAPMQFNPGNSSSLQFNPGNSSREGSGFQFTMSNLSNRGGRLNQRGRGGRHFSGRNGNARPRNG